MSEHTLAPVFSSMRLELAEMVAVASLAKAREAQLLPIAVAVVDSAGQLVTLRREDGCGGLRVGIAVAKASAAVGMGMSTRLIRDRIGNRPVFLAALNGVAQGRFVPVPGGVLILNAAGEAVGAVGISGDASDKDEYCAVAAIAASGMRSEPAEPAENWSAAGL